MTNTDTLTIPNKFNFEGNNCVIKSFINKPILKVIPNASDWNIQNLKILGKGNTNESQVGLLISAGNRFNVSNIIIEKIAGIGVLQEGGQLDASPFGQKGHFINVRCFDCWIGRKDSPNVWISGQANNYVNEYSTWIAFEAEGCHVGNITSAGNNSFVGGKLTGNYDGLWLMPSANGTHGIMSAVQINHNENYNVNIEGQTAGFEFSGCTVYGDTPEKGVVRVVNSRGIKFNGGQFESSVFCDGAYSHVSLNNVYMNGNFFPVWGGQNPENIFRNGILSANSTNPKDLGGYSPFNDIANDFVYASMLHDIAILKAVITTLDFDNVQLSQRKKYHQGSYECPYKGVYNIKGSVFLQGVLTGGYIKITKNSNDSSGYIVLVKEPIYGNWHGNFDVNIPCDIGDILSIQIEINENATLIANNATYLTIECK